MAKGKKRIKIGKIVLLALIYLFFTTLIGFIMLYVTLPNVSKLKGSIRIERKVLDESGRNYTSFSYTVGEKNANFVPLGNISGHLIHAVLAAEDIEFYSHNGFNFTEIWNSVKKNLKKGKPVRGGSTITMQLMKNLYLTGEKNYLRKLREAMLTFKAENTLSKKRILELYLNSIEWGWGIYGIKMAAKAYFRKSPADLNPSESAYLAVILPSPRRYSKAEKGSRLASYLSKRQEVILRWMEKVGYIKPSETEEIPISIDREAAEKMAEEKTTEEQELLKSMEGFNPDEAFENNQ